MPVAKHFGWCVYTSDNGATVNLKVDSYTAASNGQTLQKQPPLPNGWPYHTKDVRHWYGVASDGTKGRLTILSPATYAAGIIGTTTWTAQFNTFTLSGKQGERTLVRDLK